MNALIMGEFYVTGTKAFVLTLMEVTFAPVWMDGF